MRKISALLSSLQAGETALVNRGFASTHGLVLYEKLEPATVMLFGPPGTGKTTFAKVIAGRLGWPFIELLPSNLESGDDSMSAELRRVMTDLLQLDRACRSASCGGRVRPGAGGL